MMLELRVHVVFFLCFTTIKSDILPSINQKIQENITIKAFNTDNNILNLKFKNSENCHILIYYPQGTYISINKVYAFYTAISCKFADWTMNTIKNYIERSPLFYQHKFQSYEDVNFEHVFHSDFMSSMKILVDSLDEYIERFINILNNFLDTTRHTSYYNDTSILETLISIKIKINYVSLSTEIPDNIGSRYFNIIRLFVKELTALQNVLSFNCSDVSFSYKNSQLYGYWMSVDNIKINKGMDVFFFNLNNFKLESDNWSECKSTSMFLDMFIVQSSSSPENEILLDINKISIEIQNQKYISIQNIFDRIQIYYDIELIYWYQHFVLTTIIKIIFSQIKIMLDNFQIPYETREYISGIFKQISDDHTKIPVCLVDGFTMLVKNFEKPLTEQNKAISDFLSSFNLIKYDDNIFSNRKTFFMSEVILNEIMKKLYNNLNYLICFQQYHRNLRDKYDKFYNLPLINDQSSFIPSRFITPPQESYHNKCVCKFLLNIYSMCYEALMLYQEGSDSAYGCEILIDESSDVLNRVLLYFLIILTNATLDTNLVRMALKIIPLLVNMIKQFENNLSFSAVKRILSVIMNELNINGIKYCINSPQTNFLFFNNINFLELGNYELIENSMKTFFNFIYSNFNNNYLNKNCTDFIEYKYFILKDVYEHLLKNSKAYISYGKDILVYWKGEKKNIEDIYKTITRAFFNSYSFYAFYDIIYTFYVAVIYVDVLNLVRYFGLNAVNVETIREMLDKFDFTIFPEHLRPLLIDIKNLLLPDETEFEIRKQNIYEQFKKYNIVFENKLFYSSKVPKFIDELFGFSPKNMKAIIEDIGIRSLEFCSCQPTFLKPDSDFDKLY